jgi:glutathione S-transferase
VINYSSLHRLQSQLSPTIWKWFTTQGQEQEAAYASAVEQLRVLEGELDGKRFFAGDKMGLVDLSLGPLSYVIPVYEEITGVKMVAEETFPSLFAWMASFLSSPVVKDHLPPLGDLKPRYQAIREAFLNNTN